MLLFDMLLLLLAHRCFQRSAIGTEDSFQPSVGPHMWIVVTQVIGSGCRLEWWVGSGSVWCIRFWWWSSKGKLQFGGEYNAEMAYWSIIDSCV